MTNGTTQFALDLILLSVMLFGLASLIIPIMPGLTIIWVAVLVYAIVTGLNWGTGILFAIITILMVAGGFVDQLFMSAGEKKTGAGWVAIAVAMVAGLVGSVIWPPLGGILLALLGIFVVEIIRVRDLRKAWDSTRGMALGCGTAFFVRMGMGVVMILLWGLWAYLANR
jgi:uncharacterized protein YqgC (DUF456 family)